jgi:hypothetical protein
MRPLNEPAVGGGTTMFESMDEARDALDEFTANGSDEELDAAEVYCMGPHSTMIEAVLDLMSQVQFGRTPLRNAWMRQVENMFCEIDWIPTCYRERMEQENEG